MQAAICLYYPLQIVIEAESHWIIRLENLGREGRSLGHDRNIGVVVGVNLDIMQELAWC